MDSILEMSGPEPETAPVEIAKDTVIVALFTAPIVAPPKPRECAKQHHYICAFEGDEAHARKKEWTDLEAARRDSLIDEDTLQIRAQELDAEESSSSVDVVERRIIEGVDTAVGTTDGVLTKGVCSTIPDPHAC